MSLKKISPSLSEIQKSHARRAPGNKKYGQPTEKVLQWIL